MKKIDTLESAFLFKIQLLYDTEKQLEKALPKLAEAATNPELRDRFISHLEETKVHSARLEKIFEILGETPEETKSEGIRGIIEDGSSVAKIDAPAALKDSMIAGTARHAEHYEMAGYLSAIAEAEQLDLVDATELLEQTLKEEEAADEKLADAAQKGLATV